MRMSEPWHITITPVPKSEDCTIRTSDGNEWTVRGVALFADGGDQSLMSWFWNSPAVAAAGCVKSFAQAIRSENKSAIKFYQYLLRFMVKVTGVPGLNELSSEDALRMFEAKETYEAMKDPKKFN
jgi:hypothetical protein